LSAGGWSIEVDRQWWRGGESGPRAVVGLRPEDIHLRPAGEPASRQPFPEINCPEAGARVDLIEDLGDASVVSLAPERQSGNGRQQTENRASPESFGAVLLC